MFEIKIVSAAETRNLRQLTLRQHQAAETLIYPGDDAGDTIHYGAFIDSELVGIASVYKSMLKDFDETESWRLRGMATIERVRGMGIGKSLMEICIEHAKKQHGKLFWCNARISAEKFYEKFGMQRTGDVFYPEDLGPHVVMKMRLTD